MSNHQPMLVVIVLALVMGTLMAQDKPNFSGRWTLVDAPTSGATRGGRGGSGASGGIKISHVSGAAVNCNTECTIAHNANTLTISLTTEPDGGKPPDVVLKLDGSESTIIQSVNPREEYKATAKWDGPKLTVVRYMGPITITQTMTLDAGRLTVVSTLSGDVPMSLTYAKK